MSDEEIIKRLVNLGALPGPVNPQITDAVTSALWWLMKDPQIMDELMMRHADLKRD